MKYDSSYKNKQYKKQKKQNNNKKKHENTILFLHFSSTLSWLYLTSCLFVFMMLYHTVWISVPCASCVPCAPFLPYQLFLYHTLATMGICARSEIMSIYIHVGLPYSLDMCTMCIISTKSDHVHMCTFWTISTKCTMSIISLPYLVYHVQMCPCT